jgi:hypothetical protein
VVIHFVIVLYVIVELPSLILTQTKSLNYRPELLVLRLIIPWPTIAGRQFLRVVVRQIFAVLERLCIVQRRIPAARPKFL